MSKNRFDDQYEFLYDGILRRVMWGEPKAEIMHTLEVNQVPPDQAELIYTHAYNERLKEIRTDALRKLWGGVSTASTGAIALVIIYRLSEGYLVGGWRILAIPVLLIGIGTWFAIAGLTRLLMAKNTTGSLADLD